MTLSVTQQQQLRTLLGRTVCYHGRNGRVIEFLEQEQALVLHLENATQTMQEGQYGEPGRRADNTVLLPVFDPEQPGNLNPLLAELELGFTG